jgi:phage tail-like protein
MKMRRSAIERLLPAAYQQVATPGSVLAALLEVMADLQEPSEQRLAAVDELFAPYRTPDRFVPFLAGWLALEHLAPGTGHGADGPLAVPIGRLRDLVAEGARTAQWRGTAAGLRAVLATATGVAGFVVEEPPDRPFHIVVRPPVAARSQLALVQHIVEVEKPAAVTFEVTDPAQDQEAEQEEAK